jgi:hypothetical protein
MGASVFEVAARVANSRMRMGGVVFTRDAAASFAID